jgi:hypothetical protein
VEVKVFGVNTASVRRMQFIKKYPPGLSDISYIAFQVISRR